MIVYADFINPACYLASRRSDLLVADGVPIDWRTVQQHPESPAGGRPLTVPEQDELAGQRDDLAELLVADEPALPEAPKSLPNTEAAGSAYAEAYGSRVEHEVRALLFELHWRGRTNIGVPNDIRIPLAPLMKRSGSSCDPVWRFGYAVSPSRGPVTGAAYRRIRSWDEAWHGLGRPALPVVLDNGTSMAGLDAVRHLGGLLPLDAYAAARTMVPAGR